MQSLKKIHAWAQMQEPLSTKMHINKVRMRTMKNSK